MNNNEVTIGKKHLFLALSGRSRIFIWKMSQKILDLNLQKITQCNQRPADPRSTCFLQSEITCIWNRHQHKARAQAKGTHARAIDQKPQQVQELKTLMKLRAQDIISEATSHQQTKQRAPQQTTWAQRYLDRTSRVSNTVWALKNQYFSTFFYLINVWHQESRFQVLKYRCRKLINLWSKSI